MTIVSNPQRVCFEHALEFWTGLLVHAVDPVEPCVKQERVCTCRLCEAMSAACRRATAIAAAGPSPWNHERFPMASPRIENITQALAVSRPARRTREASALNHFGGELKGLRAVESRNRRQTGPKAGPVPFKVGQAVPGVNATRPITVS